MCRINRIQRKVTRGIILLLALIHIANTKAQDSERPNILFILIDDLGWNDAGFMGSKYYETPNMDRVAREGMVYTNAYATAPNCAPSRASILSGQYTPRHEIYTVGSSARGKSIHRKLIPIKNKTVLDTSIITIAEALKPRGYKCASIGKWHLGEDPFSGPVSQGFDTNIAGNYSGHPKSYFSPYKNKYLIDCPNNEYLTDRLTDETIRFIRANKDKPFFVYLSHYAVHTPIQAKKKLIEKYKRKKGDENHNHPVYAAMIESIDLGIGRILNTLDELGLRENTLIIIFSDNGAYGPVTSSSPLRGSKGMLYEGGIREPLIMSWPGKILAGTKSKELVIGTDFFPTIIEIAGITNFQGQILDGLSLVPTFNKKEHIKRNTLYWHFPAYLENYSGYNEKWRTTPAGAIRYKNWKLIEYFENNRLELYNLFNDIGETKDVSAQYPNKTKKLHQKLKKWRNFIHAPVPVNLNDEYKGITE